MLGAVGGAIFAYGTGQVLEETHSYIAPFFAAAFTYIVALLILVRLAPRLRDSRETLVAL
jgi:hypothetical protein